VTVRRGEPWGEPGRLSDEGVVVAGDAEARAAVQAARRAGEPIPPLGLLGGDLCRTLGGRGEPARLRSADARRLPVDLGSVLIDGRQHWFVAHLVARRSWWRGRIVAVMNAEFIGPWDVAPRAHPNDGLLEVVDVAARMPLRDRVRARSRLPSGNHVPHPDVSQARRSAVQFDLDEPLDVWLDGDPVGRARTLSVRVEPDALTCTV
jgi:hypothetical protein